MGSAHHIRHAKAGSLGMQAAVADINSHSEHNPAIRGIVRACCDECARVRTAGSLAQILQPSSCSIPVRKKVIN